MRDPKNPYKDAYSYLAREHDRAFERQMAAQKAQADASQALLIQSLRAPVQIVRPTPPRAVPQQVWAGFDSKEQRQLPSSANRNAATTKEKAFPFSAMWWLAGLIIVVLILAA